MGQALGALLPIGVAAALSSVPVMVMILILLSDRRNESAFPFLLGWVLGTIIMVSLAGLAVTSIGQPRSRHADEAVAWIEILLGTALVVLSLHSFRHRAETVSARAPAWTRRVGSWGPAKAFGVGVALNARPKGILLSAAAGLALDAAGLGIEETVVLVLVYTTIATSTVTLPILATFVARDRMEPRLVETQDWLDTNGAAITTVIFLMIGVVIIGAGVSRL